MLRGRPCPSQLENGQTHLDAKLGRLGDGQAQLRVDLAARVDHSSKTTETRMGVQDEILASFHADRVDELGRTRNALMARIDRLQEALSRRQEDEVVNLGAAEHAHRVAKDAVDEGRILGEQLSILIRKVRRLEEEVQMLRGGTWQAIRLK